VHAKVSKGSDKPDLEGFEGRHEAIVVKKIMLPFQQDYQTLLLSLSPGLP
jgi:hypothetical protein